MSGMTEDLTGDFISEYCPQCAAILLGNKVGNKWCSGIDCGYGEGEGMKRQRMIEALNSLKVVD